MGGYGADRDLVTPVRLGPSGVQRVGAQRRLVRPNGGEVRHARYTGRGAELHVIIGGDWYGTTLAAFG